MKYYLIYACFYMITTITLTFKDHIKKVHIDGFDYVVVCSFLSLIFTLIFAVYINID